MRAAGTASFSPRPRRVSLQAIEPSRWREGTLPAFVVPFMVAEAAFDRNAYHGVIWIPSPEERPPGGCWERLHMTSRTCA